MKTKISIVSAVSLVVAAHAFADTNPDGWKIATDLKKKCRVSVPADWSSDAIMKSNLTSADKSASLIVHAMGDGQSFDEAKQMAKQYVPVLNIIEDSATRLTYTTPTKAGKAATPQVAWYSVVKSTGAAPCDIQVTFNPSQEATAKKIIESLATAN